MLLLCDPEEGGTLFLRHVVNICQNIRRRIPRIPEDGNLQLILNLAFTYFVGQDRLRLSQDLTY
jgi:hypothetical protein